VRGFHAGLLAATLAVAAPSAAASAPKTQPPAPPPRVMNIVRVKVTSHNGSSYASLEGQIVRAYDRAKARVYWIGLQGPHDATDVLYLNLSDSPEAWNQMSAAYDATIKQHPELTELQQRLARLTQSTVSTLTTRRDDVDRLPQGVDFATMRTLRLTMVDVRPGREGAFLDAIRTAPAADGSWLVYEANDTSTYALITLTTRSHFTSKDGLPLPRLLRRSKGILTKVETHLYALRPAMSHPAVAPAQR
jgi:hypothetical protein